MQRASRMLFEQRDAIEAFWATEPQTLCHGDTHLGNLFFEGSSPGFLDWQAVMMGPGIRDVSYFLIASVDVSLLKGSSARSSQGTSSAPDAGRSVIRTGVFLDRRRPCRARC